MGGGLSHGKYFGTAGELVNGQGILGGLVLENSSYFRELVRASAMERHEAECVIYQSGEVMDLQLAFSCASARTCRPTQREAAPRPLWKDTGTRREPLRTAWNRFRKPEPWNDGGDTRRRCLRLPKGTTT